MSMRRAASCSQPRHEMADPRGARTGRGRRVGAVIAPDYSCRTRPTALLTDRGSQPSSRRITGKRASAIAIVNPTDSQKAGVAALVASGSAPTSGNDSTTAKPRSERSSQTAATKRLRQPRASCRRASSRCT